MQRLPTPTCFQKDQKRTLTLSINERPSLSGYYFDLEREKSSKLDLGLARVNSSGGAVCFLKRSMGLIEKYRISIKFLLFIFSFFLNNIYIIKKLNIYEKILKNVLL